MICSQIFIDALFDFKEGIIICNENQDSQLRQYRHVI